MDFRRADGRQGGGRGRVREKKERGWRGRGEGEEKEKEKDDDDDNDVDEENTRESTNRAQNFRFFPSKKKKKNLKLSPAPDKDEAEIVAEIQAIMRQITACVSFLPLLSRPVSFDLLVYADKEKTSEVPLEWEDSDARMIEEGSANNVRLRSFTTKVHRVDAMVSYKMEPDDLW